MKRALLAAFVVALAAPPSFGAERPMRPPSPGIVAQVESLNACKRLFDGPAFWESGHRDEVVSR